MKDLRIPRLRYALILLLTVLATAQKHQEEFTPPFVSLDIPPSGFLLLGPEADHESCLHSSVPAWTRASGTTFDLWVHAEGPSGAGRYWNISFGISDRDAVEPDRGFCLTTTTIGWRTLEQFSRTPLPWIADEDGNGDPELILWDSLPLHADATHAEYVLMGWVYTIDPAGSVRLDPDLTRTLAASIAAAYRDPLHHLDERSQQRRMSAAKMLEQFSRTDSHRNR